VIDAGDEFAEVVIEAPQGWVAVDWEELARSRELLYFFAWRDVKVRYKQTVLGLSWAVLQPLTSMLIFTLVFGRYAGKLPGDVAYPIYVFAGLIPWAFFSNGLMASSQSLLNNQQLLAKIYFPRLFLPAATLGPFLVEMAVSLGLYAVILAVYRTLPSWHVIFLPVGPDGALSRLPRDRPVRPSGDALPQPGDHPARPPARPDPLAPGRQPDVRPRQRLPGQRDRHPVRPHRPGDLHGVDAARPRRRRRLLRPRRTPVRRYRLMFS
jgi:hypothetical protein